MESMDQFLTKEDLYKARSERLDAENKKLREALEFYADPKTWRSGGSLKIPDNSTKDNPSYLCRGGNRARKVLNEAK